MQRYLLFLFLILSIYSFATNDKASLSGKVTNKKTGEPLAGANVYIPDLKTGATTNADGVFIIKNLPKTSVTLKISMLGYATLIQTIDLNTTETFDAALEESVLEVKEVVVTGTSQSTEIKRSPIPITGIDAKLIEQSAANNIVDVISKVPGVSAVSSGPNVSKPIIRGLGFNRVLSLYDGIRQEGQQWGDEHGVEIDQNMIERVEVVKGPASLIYGSDALAGVVNFLPAPPLPEGMIKGNVMTNYQSNNGLFANSAAFDGNKKGWVFGSRYSQKSATNYRNKYDGRVYGTSFHEQDFSAYLGLNRHWGYSHIHFNGYDNSQEIPDGSRDSISRKFTNQISEEDTLRSIVSDAELNSYKINDLFQRIQHYRTYSSNTFFMGQSKLAVKLGYQISRRREFAHPLFAEIPALDLNLSTSTYDIKFYFPESKGWESTIGINGMYQTHRNKGTEFIIPDFSTIDAGAFTFLRKNFKKLDIAIGGRYDNRIYNISELYVKTNPENGFDMIVSGADTSGGALLFTKQISSYGGFSGSAGFTYNVSDVFMFKANIGRGYRSPNINEISANGVHPGTNIYQLGNTRFKPEFSLQEDLGFFVNSSHVSGSVELFNNTISNYILNQKLLNSKGLDSVVVAGNQTYQFQQMQAQLYGGELSLDIHPHPFDRLHFENSASVVYGINKGGTGIILNDSNRYLPLIPPLHTNSEIKLEMKKKACFSGAYFKIGMEYYAAQNLVYLLENTETPTPAYVLFNAAAGSDVVNKKGKKVLSFILSCSNLTDVAYQSNMSRLKYMDNYPVNSTGRSGIYNMGRNVSVKLFFPI